MKILALIPARGGSKRIPKKNIRPLGSKPLIAWSIEIAKEIVEICDLLVSTDDQEIAEVARNLGSLVPWLRPANLATDKASSESVALHALDWYEKEKGKVDGLLLLQPTSPFRSRETIDRGISLFKGYNSKPVVGISPANSHPMWCVSVEGTVVRKFIEGDGLNMRSQDLPPAYVVNGSFYLIAPDDLRKLQSFHSDGMVPLIIDKPNESLDIDTEWDWMIAEAALSKYEPVNTNRS
ncbi:MAG: acylneuraminate cytidylyltransferase family protein [Candidatus Omnitrophica bacterium CG12_big_fil_rev_8_21_14_0_65_50_5]|nr:MAG: acylneuraminate cytidylyltransferase family protein [Candidatus Omnitrophica bacterium CG12_big_fil_rev_8_21_14_0_65_50_5]